MKSDLQSLPQMPPFEVDAGTLDAAVVALKRGGLVAFPTETVYGLGADAENPSALERLYTVKGRPSRHPVIVHLAASARLEDWAVDIPDAAYLLARTFWPGPLTLILPRSSRVPDAVTGGQETVGLRVPSHPTAQALLERFSGGIAGPSANRFGRLSPTSAAHVRADLGDDIDFILDGGSCQVGVESTIVAFCDGSPKILRPGMITLERLEAALRYDAASETINVASSARNPGLNTVSRAPGTLARHYAPRTPLELVPGERLLQRALDWSGPGALGILARRTSPFESPADGAGSTGPALARPAIHWVRAEVTPAGYARDLYARLRQMDQAGLSAIWVEAVPNDEEWAAVADRLRRAAHP